MKIGIRAFQAHATLKASLVIFIAFSLFSGCAGALSETRPDCHPRTMNPAERMYIMREAASAPFEVVTNDTPIGNEFLRLKAQPVNPQDEAVHHLAARMLATVKEEQGVGIAAPQIGVNRRVILVQWIEEKPELPFRAYYNIEITGYEGDEVIEWEGCLSIPEGFGKVKRPDTITITYETPEGLLKTEKISGYTARIFQHEIDHLNGALFIDRKEEGELMPKEEYREMRKKEREAAEREAKPDDGD